MAIDYQRFIMRDPAVCGGDPVIRGTRVTVRTVLASLAEGLTVEEIVAEFPTLDEAGLPGFDISQWHGLWLPKGTPKNIITKVNAAVMDALADPAVRSRLADLGVEIFPREQQTPEALSALQKAQIDKWWPIIKAANIKAQ